MHNSMECFLYQSHCHGCNGRRSDVTAEGGQAMFLKPGEFSKVELAYHVDLRIYCFQLSLPDSRPPPVYFSPPNAPPISAPLNFTAKCDSAALVDSQFNGVFIIFDRLFNFKLSHF
uniref:Uncharacterized protein n=1 Tax=Romanomermis culicivorax TaxID=13658 RepID=A0A915JYS0_ROMCU